MAQVLGTSGAWKDVLMQLKNLEGMNISSPQDILLKISALEQNYGRSVNRLQKEFQREVQDLKNIVQKQESTLENDIAIIRQSAQDNIQKLNSQVVQIEKYFEQNYENSIKKMWEDFELEVRDLRNTVQKQAANLQKDIDNITESTLRELHSLDIQLFKVEKEKDSDIRFFAEQIIQINQLYEKHVRELDIQLAKKQQEIYRAIESLDSEIANRLERLNIFNIEVGMEKLNFKKTRGFFNKILILRKIFRIKIHQWKFLFIVKLSVAQLKMRKANILRKEEYHLMNIKLDKLDAENRKNKDIADINDSKLRKIQNRENQINDIKNRQRLIKDDEKMRIHSILKNLNDNREKLEYFEHNKPEVMAKRRQHLENMIASAKETQINNIKNRQHTIQLEKQKSIEILRTTFSNNREKLEYLEHNQPEILARRKQNLDDEIAFFKNIQSSSEFIGAITELELIKKLSYLPDSCYVLNDLHLKINRPIHVKEKAVLTAQVDHLVITPAGVFVIETKHWSKQFVESYNFFDPYEQVTRATQLCYVLLKDYFYTDIKTRSILAYQGYIPEKQEEDYVKVLTVQEVNNYILWFKTPVLSENDMLKIKNFLQNNFL